MKRTAKAELRSRSVAELAKEAEELRSQLFKGRIAGAVEGKSLGGKSREMRRQIARLQTIITEKKPQQQKAKA